MRMSSSGAWMSADVGQLAERRELSDGLILVIVDVAEDVLHVTAFSSPQKLRA
jgi:hypothetical protein